MSTPPEAFLQFARGAITGLPTAEPDFASARQLLAAHRTLRADSVALWPPAARSALGELLKFTVVALEMGREAGSVAHLDAALAVGTSAQRLGEPAVAFLLARSDALESLYRQSRQVPR